ncbi:MAG: uroporphyrinogen decarboxylase family protein [Candidatus Thorarchaeota archaeon]|jgi:uroporphyrinogen decarboxylase
MDAPTRVLKSLNHEEPDRVPAFESAFTNNTIMEHYGIPVEGALSGGASVLKYLPFKDRIAKWAISNPNFLKKSMTRNYEFFRQVKLDIGLSLVTHTQRKIIKGGIIDEFGRIMKWETYEGDGTVIMGYHGGYFKNFEDYESWERPDPHDPRRLAAFSAGKELQKEMNNEIFSVPAINGMMEASWEAFGIEAFSKLLARPKQAKRVFDDHGKLAVELVKILADHGAELILAWDDYGFKNGIFMSPKNYRTYVFPWLKQMCDEAHKRGSKIMLHSDGDLTLIFDDIVNCGVDALHPIESTTANPEYDIFKLNEKYGDRLTFVGNLSPVMLATGNISEIEEYSKRMIRELAPGGGFFFSSGHSINPAVTLDRWKAVMRIRDKYENYPINVPH